jgi:hypothetical protein
MAAYTFIVKNPEEIKQVIAALLKKVYSLVGLTNPACIDVLQTGSHPQNW